MLDTKINMTEIIPSQKQDVLDRQFMKTAIDQAHIALENGDVPIGAVIVHQNKIIAKGYNQRHNA